MAIIDVRAIREGVLGLSGTTKDGWINVKYGRREPDWNYLVEWKNPDWYIATEIPRRLSVPTLDEYLRDGGGDTDALFVWSSTPHGHDFWEEVSLGGTDPDWEYLESLAQLVGLRGSVVQEPEEDIYL